MVIFSIVISWFIIPWTIDISPIYHLYITYISPTYHLYITNENHSEIGVINQSQVPQREQKNRWHSPWLRGSVPRKPALSDAAGRRQGGLATLDGGQARGVSARRRVISERPSGKHTKKRWKDPPCFMGKPWENHGKTMGKPWENHGKTMGKPWENHGKTMGKPWENHGKTMGKPWENGDLYGKIHHVSWVNQLFRLGHVQ